MCVWRGAKKLKDIVNNDIGSCTAVISSALIAAALEAPGSHSEMVISGVKKADGSVFNYQVKVSSTIGTPMVVIVITPCPKDHQPIKVCGRELSVLRALTRGQQDKQIAADMSLSESAVKQTVQRLYAKFAVCHTRSALISAAIERCQGFV